MMMENLTYKIQKFLLIIFCWGLTFSTTVFSINAQAEEPVVVDRIVAVVNDEIVTLYDLNETLKPYEENIQALGYPPEKLRETLFKLRSDVLNKLVDEKLADQQIKKNNLTISVQEIDMTIERIKESRSYTDEDLRAGLAEQGLTIEKYYNEHREKYAGEIKYHLWNIFIQFSQMTDESQRQIAFGKMETVLSQLKQGRSFESFAAEPPDSPESPQGTDLGFYLLDELSPQLRNVVKDMKEGEYSPILENERGYQIIYVQKVLMKDSKILTDVEAEIEDVLYNEAIDRRYNTWLSELRKRSHIKIVK